MQPNMNGGDLRTSPFIIGGLMRIIGSIETTGQKNIIELDPTPDNEKYSGFVTQEIVGVNVVFGEGLYFHGDSDSWKKACADSTSTMPCKAIALQDKNLGEVCLLLRFGTIRFDSWNFTKSKNIYVSATSPGLFTTVRPITSAVQIQVVGYSTGIHHGLFDFNSTIIELI